MTFNTNDPGKGGAFLGPGFRSICFGSHYIGNEPIYVWLGLSLYVSYSLHYLNSAAAILCATTDLFIACAMFRALRSMRTTYKVTQR